MSRGLKEHTEHGEHTGQGETAERAALVEALLQGMRALSAQVVMFHQATAERLGLNATDIKCLDLLARYGSMAPGRLAELTGLTTGAITGVLDRLERAGYVRREAHAHDRRRVIVRLLGGNEQRVNPLYAPLEEASRALAERYTDEELALLLDFIAQNQRMLEEETDRATRANQGGVDSTADTQDA